MGERRLGVLGGTFNPIHCGHIHLARQALELLGLSEIHFVVAAIPPHKPRMGLTPLLHRYAMVCLATAGKPEFIPSLVEIEPPESPFTVDTLKKMISRSAGSGSRSYFLAGGDSLRDVATWRHSDRLLAECSFVFFVRPGVPLARPAELLPPGSRKRLLDLRGLGLRALARAVHEAESTGGARVFVVDAGAPDISSSDIRRRISEGVSLGTLVPQAVQRYIKKLELYGER